MRGLIYKDISIFFKSIQKKIIVIAIPVIVLLLIKTGIYAGLLATIMLALTVSIQTCMSFASDEKADWKKYQLALPVSGFSVVASKYISVVCTSFVSLAGSILFNLLSWIFNRHLDMTLFGISIAAAVIIPLMWSAVCLPLCYWFGFHSTQILEMITILPLVYLIKYFEDGSGVSAMTGSACTLSAIALVAVFILFGISLVISVLGYEHRI